MNNAINCVVNFAPCFYIIRSACIINIRLQAKVPEFSIFFSCCILYFTLKQVQHSGNLAFCLYQQGVLLSLSEKLYSKRTICAGIVQSSHCKLNYTNFLTDPFQLSKFFFSALHTIIYGLLFELGPRWFCAARLVTTASQRHRYTLHKKSVNARTSRKKNIFHFCMMRRATKLCKFNILFNLQPTTATFSCFFSFVF